MPVQKAAWILKFAAELHRRLPGVSAEAVTSIATAEYQTALNLSAEEAAEIYAREQPPADVGAPGD